MTKISTNTNIVGGKFLKTKSNGLKLIKGGTMMGIHSVAPVFNFSDDDLVDIISSSVYDIGYWACINNDTNEWWDARSELPKSSTFEDLMYHILKKGESILIMDVEDDEEEWDLTLDKLLNGIKLAIEQKYWDGDIDTIDGEVGDIVFQMALFGEIVYG
jgi:hypothetical protein